MKDRVLIEQDEDGMHVAEVPSLAGCVSQGRPRQQALQNIREAITAYMESLDQHGEAAPHQSRKKSSRLVGDDHHEGVDVVENRVAQTGASAGLRQYASQTRMNMASKNSLWCPAL